MSDVSLSNRLVARLGGALAATYGVAVLVGLPQLSGPGPRRWILLAVGISALLCCAVAWRLPWERWSPNTSLWLAPVALSAVAVANMAALPKMPFMYSIFYLAIFGWTGVGHRQYTSLKMATPATISFLSPLVLAHGDVEKPIILVASWSFLLPLCLLTGESLSWISGRLRQAERRDVRRLDSMAELLEASSTLAQLDDPDALASAVASMAGKLLDGEAAVTILLESDGTSTVAATWQRRGSSEVLDVDSGHSPAIIEAIHAQDVRVLDGLDGTGSPLFVLPLSGTCRAIGAVGVLLRRESPAPDPFASDLGRALATQSGLAFERAWSMQSLIDDALRDELTGLGNRRHAAVLLSRLTPGSTLVMLDLDHFKRVNDTLGHDAGDDLLRDVGTYLRNSLRTYDQIARWGGDEFLIVLQGRNEAPWSTMERIREDWLATDPGATFSAGVAVHTQWSTPSETLGRADAAMYRAKRAGRDCILEERVVEAAV